MSADPLGPLVAWPVMLLAAWLAGEWVFRRWHLPRVCAYGALGLVLASVGASREVASHASLTFMANVALALTLFEPG